jgi:hypothetical protein
MHIFTAAVYREEHLQPVLPIIVKVFDEGNEFTIIKLLVTGCELRSS